MTSSASSSGGTPNRELRLRIISAIILAIGAFGTAWMGGILFNLVWCAAGLLVLREWFSITGGSGLAWKVPGILAALAVVVAPVMIRLDPTFGLQGILWLFAVVWGTDILAFVFGRTLGGPKLWVRVSPKKTWSGFVGGVIGGAVCGWAVAALIGVPDLVVPTVLAAALAVAVHGGDLLESAAKRHFKVKDSGRLIPGHGGVMDRLDGFVFAAAIVCLVGVGRHGWQSAAQGFLVW